MKIERLFTRSELRVAESGQIEGYAAVFNELSVPLWGFREKIRPGAFAKTLQEADVRALLNHDSNYVLGRNKARTLELSEDETGLAVVIEPPATTWASDLAVSMRRGDINQMSFGFETVRDSWREDETGTTIRELVEVRLFDVSVVTYPAYPQTTVAVRQNFYRHLESRGDELAALLNRRIEEITDGATSRADVVARMAYAAGLAGDTVRSVLVGGKQPTTHALKQFAAVLELPLNDLLSTVRSDGRDTDTQPAPGQVAHPSSESNDVDAQMALRRRHLQLLESM